MSRKAKTIDPVITVNTVFVGTQTDSQAFIDLIAQKRLIDKREQNCHLDTKNTADIKSTVFEG